LEKENARLKLEKEELKEHLAEKTEQISELRKDNEGLQQDGQLEIPRENQEKLYDKPGLPKTKKLEIISEKADKDFETTLFALLSSGMEQN
jgi:hypothetical protein